jgi:hypothetical protein
MIKKTACHFFVYAILCFFFLEAFSQYENCYYPAFQRCSSEAERCNCPCIDTIRILYFKSLGDINDIFPAWLPVVDVRTVVELEGYVFPKANGELNYTHVSAEDFPLNHYTHDFTFDVKPDSTPDNRFINLLAKKDFHSFVDGKEVIDTVIDPFIHVEWECGIAAGNFLNPAYKANKRGNSYGFFSAGHERRDVFWNWPAIGDWVHAEGLWVWDRGHPPARTEIHPLRFVACRRNLPDLINIPNKEDKIFATKIDVFASGDGGALYNNRNTGPDFVEKVRMSDKDYGFNVKIEFPKPSENANLNYIIKDQKGNTHNGKLNIEAFGNGDSSIHFPYLHIEIPWKNLPDTLVFAKTIYAYWDEGNGIAENYKINSYKVSIEQLYFKRRKENINKSEFRIFMEVGGNWIFFNEHVKTNNVVDGGIGHTYKRKWNVNKEFIIHVPENKRFRVFSGGWEGDGIDRIMGELMHPYSPCNTSTKLEIQAKLFTVYPVTYSGCLDDFIGEVGDFYKGSDLHDFQQFQTSSDGNPDLKTGRDPCPFSSENQTDIFRLFYNIQKIESEEK